MEVPLPWERLLWTSRAFLPRRARYVLTDFRLVAIDGERSDEIAIEDFGDIHRTQRWPQRLAGLSTIAVSRRGRKSPPFVLRHIRRGPQLAALFELLAGDPHASLDADTVRSALQWEPRTENRTLRRALAATAVALVAVFAVAIRLSGTAAGITYRPDDEIYPLGQKKPREEIVRFMETEVLPWARVALRPIVGAGGTVTCETCHAESPETRDWQMPSVAVLPAPEFRRLAWEHSTISIDAQLRNAIYGYFAESDNQNKAAYMREVVMPGMARLLHRPAYDFARSYEYNRSHFAFGCYHCHRVN